MHILGNRTSLDKYVLNGILKHKILGRYELVRLRGTQTAQTALGKLAKQIFGKSWEFGPTGLTPAPLPIRWDSQKGKKKIMFILHFRLF